MLHETRSRSIDDENRARTFKLSKILGQSSVVITERTYAHLRPDAYEADDGRVRFRLSDEDAAPWGSTRPLLVEDCSFVVDVDRIEESL